MADAPKPDFSQRSAAVEASDGGVITPIKFVVAAIDVDGDELIVICRTKQWPHRAIKDFRSPAADFFQITLLFGGRHEKFPECFFHFAYQCTTDHSISLHVEQNGQV
jgi:hypothetical protein